MALNGPYSLGTPVQVSVGIPNLADFAQFVTGRSAVAIGTPGPNNSSRWVQSIDVDESNPSTSMPAIAINLSRRARGGGATADVDNESTFGFLIAASDDPTDAFGWQIASDANSQEPYLINFPSGQRRTELLTWLAGLSLQKTYNLYWDDEGVPQLATSSRPFNLGGTAHEKLYVGGRLQTKWYLSGNIIYESA